MKNVISRRSILAGTAVLALGLLTFGAHQASADALDDIAKAGVDQGRDLRGLPAVCVARLRHEDRGL